MLQIWFIDKAFEGSNIYTVEDIPDDIDVMVLSHDHLLPRTEKCITPATAGMMDVLKGSGSSSAVLIWHWWKTDNTMKLGTACI